MPRRIGAGSLGHDRGRPAAGALHARVGTAPAMPRASLLGSVSGSRTIALDVALRPRDPASLARFATAVSTPGSSDFRRYLSPGEFGATFGATAATVSATATALRKLGLHVDSVSRNRLLIKVSSTVATAERAFGTTLRRYRLGSGSVVFANSSAPRLPEAVARGIQTVVGLSDLPVSYREDLARPGRRARPLVPDVRSVGATETGGPQPCPAATAAAGMLGAYTADELASAYRFSGLYQTKDLGEGETVAIFELEPNARRDIAAYQRCYQTMATVSYIKVDSGSGTGPGEGEAALDIENVIGLAPRASIDVYQGPNTNVGPLDVYNSIINQDRAKIISTSWGICEAQLGGRAVASVEANMFEQAAAQGQTVVAAAGDDGSTDCTNRGGEPLGTLAVDDPGSQPYVTSVGGTSLSPLGPPPSETVWNGGAGGAGGGGISSMWAMPAYQADAAPRLRIVKSYSSPKPCGAPAGYCREVPDVSADADPQTGYLVYWNGSWTVLGGTSGSAPLWAALVALTDAWPGCTAHPVGFLNPSLYLIAGAGASASALNDVTRGDNNVFGPGLYPASVGYDLATGLGTPDAANPLGRGLVSQLCALPQSGGSPYASPTTSSLKVLRPAVKANGTAFSVVKVTLRAAFGSPVPHKRVILVSTGTTPTRITPTSVITNAKGVASFDVRDTAVQKVKYRATDLTDGVVLQATATVSYLKP